MSGTHYPYHKQNAFLNEPSAQVQDIAGRRIPMLLDIHVNDKKRRKHV